MRVLKEQDEESLSLDRSPLDRSRHRVAVVCAGQQIKEPAFSGIMGVGEWCPGKDWVATIPETQICWGFWPSGGPLCTGIVYRFQLPSHEQTKRPANANQPSERGHSFTSFNLRE
jgi:hypothetical protein